LRLSILHPVGLYLGYGGVLMTHQQAERQFDYFHRRMSYADTASAQDYWWRKIQDLGAADARGEITDRKH
jgi:hypothetical protein